MHSTLNIKQVATSCTLDMCRRLTLLAASSNSMKACCKACHGVANQYAMLITDNSAQTRHPAHKQMFSQVLILVPVLIVHETLITEARLMYSCVR